MRNKLYLLLQKIKPSYWKLLYREKFYSKSIEKKIKTNNIVDLEKPIFSVIIPIYDRTWELRNAIDSLLNQTFINFEIILICDGSPIETLEVVNEYEKHSQIRSYKFLDNSGNACRGRNKALQLAKGEIIAFLDSDDIALPDRLYITYKIMLETNADFLSGAIEFVVDGSRTIKGIKDKQIAVPTTFNLDLLKKYNLMYTCTVAIRKCCFDKYGYFRQKMRYREDHELWLRLAYHGCKIVSTHKVLSKYRVHSGNAELKFIDQDDKWYQMMLDYYDKPYDWSD